MDGELNTTCPWCEARNDTFTSIEGNPTPSPDSLSLCPYCAKWSVFDDRLALRKPSRDEILEIAFSPGLLRLQTAFKQSDLYRG